MPPVPVRIPERLVRSTLAWHGAVGARWIERLPALVADLVDRFELRDIGEPFEPGGHTSWCGPARTASDDDVVLKVPFPDPEVAPEAAALRCWDGRAAVRVVAHDPERWALVVERCRPGWSLADLEDPLEGAAAGADVAVALHQAGAGEGPVPGARDLGPVMAEWAAEVEERAAVVRRAGLDPGVIAAGVEAFRTLPAGAPRTVLLHGDLNPTNVLAAERSAWLAIDPKPMVGDPAWDGVRLVLQPDPARWADPGEVLADRLAVVADALDVDRARLATWCLADTVQMVTSPDNAADHRRLGLVASLASRLTG